MQSIRLGISSAVCLGLMACSIPQQRLDDDGFYAAQGAWNHPLSKAKCYTAAERAVKSMTGTLETGDAEAGSLITSRITLPDAVTINPVTGRPEPMGLSYSVRYYLKVAGDSANCSVRLVRMRIYSGNTELASEAAGYVQGRVNDMRNAMNTAVKDLTF